MDTEDNCICQLKVVHGKLSNYSTIVKKFSFFFFLFTGDTEIAGQAALVLSTVSEEVLSFCPSFDKSQVLFSLQKSVTN